MCIRDRACSPAASATSSPSSSARSSPWAARSAATCPSAATRRAASSASPTSTSRTTNYRTSTPTGGSWPCRSPPSTPRGTAWSHVRPASRTPVSSARTWRCRAATAASATTPPPCGSSPTAWPRPAAPGRRSSPPGSHATSTRARQRSRPPPEADPSAPLRGGQQVGQALLHAPAQHIDVGGGVVVAGHPEVHLAVVGEDAHRHPHLATQWDERERPEYPATEYVEGDLRARDIGGHRIEVAL